MTEESQTLPARRSAPEFLAALEESGILPRPMIHELRERLEDWADADDAMPIVRQLVRDGTLTTFQARRLMKGKQRGLVFGRYILLDHIGQGARGQVFKARHSLMDRVVALKVVLPDSGLNKSAVARFFREMRIVGRLDHPNVVRALDADEQSGCPYIVMEYLEGEDLERVFARRGPLPPSEVIGFMAQAARGLGHAHERGVIHRDVKPTNLFLVDTGVVKVLDLGMGDLVGTGVPSGDGFDTDEGVVVGTTDFMSPELIRGREIDARADLFSLGCTMYRLLTGAFAFPGITREDRLVKRIRGGHVPITDVRPDLSYALVDVVDRALAVRPEDRYGSAGEMAEALEALLPRGRGAAVAPGHQPPGADVAPIHSQPDAPPDWSLIESALRPADRPSRKAARLVDQPEPKAPSVKALDSHRRSLEEEGIESGRDVHEKYRNELVQMNRVMAELRSMSPDEDSTEESVSRFERLGEKLGDYLAEPSAGLILIVVLAVVLLLGLGLAAAIG